MQLEKKVDECMHAMSSSNEHLKKDGTIIKQLVGAFHSE